MGLYASALFWNAAIAGTLVALIAVPVGYFIVLRAHAFAGEALKDVGFAGAAGAALLGWSTLVGMIALSLAAAIGLGALSRRVRGRDVEVGMVLSFALGLGVLFLSLFAHSSAGHSAKGINLLFGSMLSIQRSDLYIELACGIAVIAAIAAIFRPLLFASIDPVVAEARGVPTRFLSIAFLFLIGVTTAASVLVVGVLLVAALLIAPAAAAVNLTRTPRSALAAGLAISLGSTWAGLALAFAPFGHNPPVGFTISAIAAIAYFLSTFVRMRGRRRFALPAHPSREVHAKEEVQ